MSVGTGGLTLSRGQSDPVIVLDSDTAQPGSLILNGSVVQTTPNAGLLAGPVRPGEVPGTVDLGGAPRQFDIDQDSALTVSARVLNGGIVKRGGGVLLLDSPSSDFQGGIVVNEGTLTVAAPAAFGGGLRVNGGRATVAAPAPFAGGLEVTGGTAVITSPAPFAGRVRVGRGQSSFGTLEVDADDRLGAASNAVELSGGVLRATGSFTTARTITLGDDDGEGAGMFDVTADNTLTITSRVSGRAGLVKSGTGTLVLGAANTYTGATTVTQGTLRLAPGASLFNDPAGFTARVSVAEGATLDLAGVSLNVGGIKDAGGGGRPTTSGSILLGGATLTIADNGTDSIFSGSIGGPGGLAKISPGPHKKGEQTFSGPLSFTGGGVRAEGGTLVLSGPNTFTGNVSVGTGGTLAISTDQSLGAASNGVLLDGGTLRSAGKILTHRGFVITAAGGELDVEGQLTLSAGATLGGPVPNLGSLAKSGTGQLRLMTEASLRGIDVREGTLYLAGPDGSVQAETLSLEVGGRLVLSDAPETGGRHLAGDRVGDGVTIVGRGGELSLLAGEGAVSSESLGVLSLGGGTTTIRLDAGLAGSVELRFASLTRLPGKGALVAFSADDLGQHERVFIEDQKATDSIGRALVDWGAGIREPAAYDLLEGVVPVSRYNQLAAARGQPQLTAPAVLVPEPGLGVLLLLATVGAGRRGRRPP